MKIQAMNICNPRYLFLITTFLMLTLFQGNPASAQHDSPYIRIAKIIVDSAHLEGYKAALKEEMEAAVRVEQGVLTLYGVYDKDNPTHVTTFEIYADKAAYEAHIQTPHFKKYKATVQDMVKSLELTDVMPVALASKK